MKSHVMQVALFVGGCCVALTACNTVERYWPAVSQPMAVQQPVIQQPVMQQPIVVEQPVIQQPIVVAQPVPAHVVAARQWFTTQQQHITNLETYYGQVYSQAAQIKDQRTIQRFNQILISTEQQRAALVREYNERAGLVDPVVFTDGLARQISE